MSTISAGNTTTTSLIVTGDTTGNLVFTTGGANTTALTLNNAQVATFSGNVTAQSVTTTSSTGSVNSINTFGFKNRIINGNMVIDQRNAGAAVTVNSNTGTQYCVDRFVIQGTSSAGVFTDQQLSTTPPANFSYYSHITVTTADASPAAAALYTIAQIIEGNNIQDLGFGTANAKSVSVSFWVRSSLTGTFGASLRNGTSFNYSYPFQYTISAANTWTYITITIAGPTSGTWASGSGGGLVLTFDLGCGSNLTSASANTWQSGNYNSVTGSTRVMATNAATWDITGVQLEVGSSATSFDFRDYGRELLLCQRYYQYVNTGGTALGAGYFGSITSGSAAYHVIYFPATFRAGPTVTTSTINSNSSLTISSVTGYPTSAFVSLNAPVITSTNAYIFYNYTASAEL